METAQFHKAFAVADSLGYVMTRGVGGRLFVVWLKGTDGRKSKRFESIKAALSWCKTNSVWR
jgi:hypothetical protein